MEKISLKLHISSYHLAVECWTHIDVTKHLCVGSKVFSAYNLGLTFTRKMGWIKSILLSTLPTRILLVFIVETKARDLFTSLGIQQPKVHESGLWISPSWEPHFLLLLLHDWKSCYIPRTGAWGMQQGVSTLMSSYPWSAVYPASLCNWHNDEVGYFHVPHGLFVHLSSIFREKMLIRARPSSTFFWYPLLFKKKTNLLSPGCFSSGSICMNLSKMSQNIFLSCCSFSVEFICPWWRQPEPCVWVVIFPSDSSVRGILWIKLWNLVRKFTLTFWSTSVLSRDEWRWREGMVERTNVTQG